MVKTIASCCHSTLSLAILSVLSVSGKQNTHCSKAMKYLLATVKADTGGSISISSVYLFVCMITQNCVQTATIFLHEYSLNTARKTSITFGNDLDRNPECGRIQITGSTCLRVALPLSGVCAVLSAQTHVVSCSLL